MSDETITRCVVLDGLKTSDTFDLEIQPDIYDTTLSCFTSDKSINEKELIWADRSGVPNTPAWDPSQIAGLSFWLDASDATTLTLTGNTVDQWDSKVGTISGTAPAGNRPEYDANANGGRGAVVFDQSDPVDKQWLNFGDVLKPTSATGLTVMGVFQVRNHAVFSRGFAKWEGSTDNDWMISPTVNTRNRIVYRASTNVASSNTGTTDNVNFHTYGGIYDNGTASNIISFYDGASASAASVTTPSAIASTTDLYLARDATVAGNFCELAACEVLAFLRPLSTFERQVVEGYLAHKWGTAQFLPEAHPFRLVPPGYIENLREVAYAPSLGLFAAVSVSGVGNRIITSPDGITWTTRTSPENNAWNSLTWSEQVGAFAAVASTGTNRAMRSVDGINWTTQTIASQNWFDVKYFPQLAQFYAVSSTGATGRVASSPDGITWTLLTTDTTTFWRGIGYSPTLGTGQGRLVVVGQNVNTDDRLMYSDDGGTTWTLAQITLNRVWYRVAWSPVVNRFVAVNDNGNNTAIAYSDDGITWAITNAPALCRSLGLSWVDDLGLYVIASFGGSPFEAFTSPDGITWTGTNTLTGSSSSFGVAYGGGKVVLVGNNGRIFTSFAGRQQRPIKLSMDELETGDGRHDVFISDTTNWNIPNVHYATSYISNRIRYKIETLEGLPINRKFLAVFQLKKNNP